MANQPNDFTWKETGHKLKVAIVTSSMYSFASTAVELLKDSGQLTVIFNTREVSLTKRLSRSIRKLRRIGILGGILGAYNRRFYQGTFENLMEVCNRNNIRVIALKNFKVPPELLEDLKEIDLGISLGNGLIPKSFFSVFPKGMWNIHHELLPEYKGAQAIIWQLYNYSGVTGFTIHEINSKIDDGRILLRKTFRIMFHATLGETICKNYRLLLNESLLCLRDCIDLERKGLLFRSDNQGERSYTTPTVGQYLRIVKNFKHLKAAHEGKN